VEDLAVLASREGRRPRPIYGAHRWFARRFGSAFRTLLTAAALPEGADFWTAYYEGTDYWHGKIVLDPFVGGGTSVVEASRLGADVVGVDVDAVACAITRFETHAAGTPDLEPVLSRLKEEVGNKLAPYYRTETAEGEIRQVLHYFWVQLVTCGSCAETVEAHPNHQLAHEADGDRQWAFCPGCNTLNFAYILFLSLRGAGVPNEEIERYVRRWFVMSVLTARYSGASETVLGQDIRRVQAEGISTYLANVISGELSDAFWETSLPQEMNTSAASSTYFRLFEAVQIRSNDPGFLSRDINVRELVEVKSDVHHIFPSGYLKPHGLKPAQYNQIANYAVTQSEINIAIGKEEPRIYFARLKEQCSGGPKYYGNITDPQALKDNLRAHCIPKGVEEMTVDDYPDFLAERRGLMARKIRAYFEGL